MSQLGIDIQKLTIQAENALGDAIPRAGYEEFSAVDCSQEALKVSSKVRVAARAMGRFADASADADDWWQATAYYAAAHALGELSNALEQREIYEPVARNTKGCE